MITIKRRTSDYKGKFCPEEVGDEFFSICGFGQKFFLMNINTRLIYFFNVSSKNRNHIRLSIGLLC